MYNFRDGGVGLRALHLSCCPADDHTPNSRRHVALGGGRVARFADMQQVRSTRAQ